MTTGGTAVRRGRLRSEATTFLPKEGTELVAKIIAFDEGGPSFLRAWR